MVACAYGGWASNCRSLGVKLASHGGASVACGQPPSAKESSPTSRNASLDLRIVVPKNDSQGSFASRIVQNSWPYRYGTQLTHPRLLPIRLDAPSRDVERRK